ncbi:hypothetical protein NDU88_000291, partial [Pleurodeles waltl]
APRKCPHRLRPPRAGGYKGDPPEAGDTSPSVDLYPRRSWTDSAHSCTLAPWWPFPGTGMMPEDSTEWLHQLLRELQLDQFYAKIRDDLNVTRLSHFDFVRPLDLDHIGMGKPAQRRLFEAIKRRRPPVKPKSWMYK